MEFNNRYNRKRGFVLSLDALLAVIIVIVALSFSINYFFQTKEKIHYLYSAKEAHDALAVLDYNNILDTLDEVQIMQEISKLLPSSEAKFNITTTDTELSGKTTIVFNNTEKNFVISGKRFFVLKNETVDGFGVVRYSVWKK